MTTKRVLFFVGFFLVMGLLVAACGDAATATPAATSGNATPAATAPSGVTIPLYGGATQITIPSDYMSRVNPDGKTQTLAYKTTDAPAKVNAYYLDQVGKNGWTDGTKNVSNSQGAQKIISGGGFVVAGSNDKLNQFISVQIITGNVAQVIGFSDLTDQDTLIVIQIL